MTEKKSNPAPIGRPTAEVMTAQHVPMINAGETELGAMIDKAETADKVEGLAKRLCEAAGHRPDAYFMGRERWTQFIEDATRFIAAFEFMKELDDVG